MAVGHKIGIVGLGSMGQGMAKNILDSGIGLKGFDIFEGPRDAFAAAGGKAVAQATEAAAGVDALLLMVVNAKQANAVLFDEDNAAAAMPPGATVILCSTVAPSDARALAARVQNAGLLFLDAPVSGGKVGAEEGTLTIMASGPDAAFNAAADVLKAISKKVYRLGNEPGMGATYKVVHQLAAGVHLVAAAELMALGARAGCDAKVLYDIVSTSAGQSWMFNDRVPHMLDDDYTPRSMVDIFIKDLGLVLQTGNELNTPLPLSAAAHQMLLGASSIGCGKLDDSAVIKAYEALTGVQVLSGEETV
jgi:3-hydroxyisobutyrate dehydrogenase